MNVRSSRAAARAGFTLMEVLVVVAILVILAGTGSVMYMKALDQAKEDRAKIGVENLTRAVGLYQIKNGDYPPNLQVLIQPPDGGRPYVEPSELMDPWGHPYNYAYPGQHHMATGVPDIWSNGLPNNPLPIGNWNNADGGR